MLGVENLRDTIIPKSDQLNADDLVGFSRNITVTEVRRGGNEDPVVIHYEGDNGRPYKPCKTMRKLLIYAWGQNGNYWVGKSMTLYCDPSVKWAGKEVGGIRISHLSDIETSLAVNLTATRGSKKLYTIDILQPQEKPYWPQDKFDAAFAKMKASIESGKKTPEQVINQCESQGHLTDDMKQAIRESGKNEDDSPVNTDGFFGDE